MILKLYSDRKYLPGDSPHVPLLCPFWGMKNTLDAVSNGFEAYQGLGYSLYQLTTLAESNFAILPADWRFYEESSEHQELAKSLIKAAVTLGKKTIIFHWHDHLPKLDFTNVIFFHTSLYKSKQSSSDFALPFWGSDMIETQFDGNLPIMQKSDQPTVGFCGHIGKQDLSIKTSLKKIGSKLGFNISQPPENGARTRTLALNNLTRSPFINTDFIVRDRFYGGAMNDKGEWDYAIIQKVRQDYITNLMGNNYTLCVRGLGNYSQRFYDTLCCGKIPVFVNTDCVLPYDFLIAWRKYCVWIEEYDLPRISQKIMEFHNQLSAQDFVDMQYECRKIWEEWLSPEGFFTNFHRHFINT